MYYYSIKIIQIDWLDKENPEAEVLFEIDGLQLWAFCHPCRFSEGEITSVYFSFIEENTSEASFWNENSEQRREMVTVENLKCSIAAMAGLKVFTL